MMIARATRRTGLILASVRKLRCGPDVRFVPRVEGDNGTGAQDVVGLMSEKLDGRSWCDEAPLFVVGAATSFRIDCAFIADVVQVHPVPARLIHDLKRLTASIHRPEHPTRLSGVVATIGGLDLRGAKPEDLPAFGPFGHIALSERENEEGVRTGVPPDGKGRLTVLPTVH